MDKIDRRYYERFNVLCEVCDNAGGFGIVFYYRDLHLCCFITLCGINNLLMNCVPTVLNNICRNYIVAFTSSIKERERETSFMK